MGRDKVERVLMGLKGVYISHMHASFLTYYHAKFEPILCNSELVQCEQLILYNVRDEVTMVENEAEKHQPLYPDTLKGVLTDLGLVELFTMQSYPLSTRILSSHEDQRWIQSWV